MRRLNSFCCTSLALAFALVCGHASAQETDTLSISGTFHADELREYQGTVGADLAEVFAHDNDHWWTLTLYGVTYSHSYSYYEWNDEWSSGYDEAFITHVHATSYDFEFFGPDADVLNQVVSQQLDGLSGNLIFNLQNGDYYDSADWFSGGPYAAWYLALFPVDDNAGVSFSAGHWWFYPLFSTDEFGYPVVEPQRVPTQESLIEDLRLGNSGALVAYGDVVDIGSAEPPLPPSLKILDGFVLEGDRGTTRLELTVTLSRSSITGSVTVNYATVSGTALAKQDYTATSGTLTILPGQTGGTISIAVKGDRKREGNETFSVRLSNAVGATIDDGVATVTILNDD